METQEIREQKGTKKTLTSIPKVKEKNTFIKQYIIIEKRTL